MVIVVLKDVELYAYHGVGEAERTAGGRYVVNVSVTYNEKKSTFTDLEDTINYVTIFNIVRQRMGIPSTLLEQVASDIIHEIQQQFNIVNEIECSIYKIRAPIENLNGKVGIHLLKKFNE